MVDKNLLVAVRAFKKNHPHKKEILRGLLYAAVVLILGFMGFAMLIIEGGARGHL